jgi:hypothetical protein
VRGGARDPHRRSDEFGKPGHGAPPALDKSGFDMPSHDGSAAGVLIVLHTSCFRLTQIVAVTFDT